MVPWGAEHTLDLADAFGQMAVLLQALGIFRGQHADEGLQGSGRRVVGAAVDRVLPVLAGNLGVAVLAAHRVPDN